MLTALRLARLLLLPGLTALAARARWTSVMHMEVQPILDRRHEEGRRHLPPNCAKLGIHIRQAALVAAANHLAEEPLGEDSRETTSHSPGGGA